MSVKIWQETVVIPTYEAGVPDKNPMFFEKRVYQGSSGAVYPNPVIESISDEKTDKEYNALFLENKYLKIMILPELGGRVQMAYDKIANRHFIYYNQVIKPALVGLCGPWISGGIEFNWPQHHRPSTFEPVDFKLEEHPDGSKTVWVNEVEKMFRTRGTAGFTLHPDKAYLEIRAKLYNRTSLPQTFLWWANPAVSVGDHYQSVFPPDVNAVFDHGKRDVSTFPIATGTYYKVDYSPGTDISRYKNIPVPTSYMAVNSEYNFVGGYEHDTEAGVLHVADHHVSPGKKQWTWGNGDFGLAWDRNLTDEDGPYIELMTGVFTDNQPDFSWLMPYEEKTFTQYFMPYRKVGMVKNATKDVLIGLERTAKNQVAVKVFVTSAQPALRVLLSYDEMTFYARTIEISPEQAFEDVVTVKEDIDETRLVLIISTPDGKELLRFQPPIVSAEAIPQPAKPAPDPVDAENAEQLFLIGQHLEQYRHATYDPAAYYREALRRDPKDVRNNNALGKWLLRRGQFAASEPYFRKAVETSIGRNPNPYDGEPHYNLGLSLYHQEKFGEAYNAFFKSTWSSAFQDGGYFNIALIDVLRGDLRPALEHIDWSLDRNARNAKAYVLKAYTLRKLGQVTQSIAITTQALQRDGFNLGALWELAYNQQSSGDSVAAEQTRTKVAELSRKNTGTLIEYAIDYAAFGAFTEANELLYLVANEVIDDPLYFYYTAYFMLRSGAIEKADAQFRRAAAMDTGLCFPNRLEDIMVLQTAAKRNKNDSKAFYYLGNLWYDKRQYADAIQSWEQAIAIDDKLPTPNRNLAIAAFNKQHDHAKALKLFEKAFSLDTEDARVLMELDQLYKRINHSPETRLANLKSYENVAARRDDLYLEIAALHNFLGAHELAYNLIMKRKFHPWEGGEGRVSGQYIYSLVEMAKQSLHAGDAADAIDKLGQSQVYPHNLGEGKLPGAQENDVFYWLGCAYRHQGDENKAAENWKRATVGLSEPSAAMFYNDQQPDKIFYQGLAWRSLRNEDRAIEIFENLVRYAHSHLHDEVKIDYFAVSLPDLLIFEADLNVQNRIHCLYIAALGYLGLRDLEKAEANFKEVLAADSMHFGARTHLSMMMQPSPNAS